MENNQLASSVDLSEQLSKLNYDELKQSDTKFILEVLSIASENRTISDLDTLSKILLHVEPIKRINNMSTTYFLAQRMTILKCKSKQIIFEEGEMCESLYILLSGKIALYKKSVQFFEQDEVVFLTPGSCFGKFYDWKVKFLPISVESSVLAIIPKLEVAKIPIHLSLEKQYMFKELKGSDLFLNSEATKEQLQQACQNLTLTKVPCGTFLIRQGETPKAIFYVLKGIVKQLIKTDQNGIIEVKRYSQSEYCPKSLKGMFRFELIAESACELIVIPKKIIKLLKNPIFDRPEANLITIINEITNKLTQKNQWEDYKIAYIQGMIGKSLRQPQKQQQKPHQTKKKSIKRSK